MPRKYRVLVVDDERAITHMLAEVLEMHDYETATAFSGEEAVALAASFHPDFLISDVVMGEMNGIEAAGAILAEHPKCKVLFISGNVLWDTPGRQSLKDAMARGMKFEVLEKPIKVSTIVSKVSEMLSSDGNP